MPFVGDRCLFVRRLPDGRDFYFYGFMETAKTVRMILLDKEVDWFHITRWKYESRD
jgi:hypothetical protein